EVARLALRQQPGQRASRPRCQVGLLWRAELAQPSDDPAPRSRLLDRLQRAEQNLQRTLALAPGNGRRDGLAHAPEWLSGERLPQRLQRLSVALLTQRRRRLDAPIDVGVVAQQEAQRLGGLIELQRLDEPAAVVEAHAQRAARQRDIEGLVGLLHLHTNHLWLDEPLGVGR